MNNYYGSSSPLTISTKSLSLKTNTASGLNYSPSYIPPLIYNIMKLWFNNGKSSIV